MEKKEPHPEKRPHLEDSFSTVVYFNRLICTRDANKRKNRTRPGFKPKIPRPQHGVLPLHYLVSVFFYF